MKILLAVSGGIAAYKSLELCRQFIKAGHHVQVVMSESAKQFIQPLSFQALSGHAVRDSLFDNEQEAGMGHIELARWADWIVLAPASANTLAKIRMGLADNLLSTLILATDRPVLMVPAMNRLMWQNPATQENIQILQNRGYHVLQPASGPQACGEVGAGRMPEALEIFQAWQALQISPISQPYWQGQRLLISAGPTFEDLDPVRFLGNRSSGKMGFAIAEQAQKMGAKVTLIAGPVTLATPFNVHRIDVRSAQQMFAAVQAHYAQNAVFISAAAVADFALAQSSQHKIKKQPGQDGLTLQLVKNPDIVAWVAAQSDKPFVVGFAAETQNVLEYARAKLHAKKLDMICANQVGENLGFEREQNQLTLLSAQHEKILPTSTKSEQAQQLLAFIAEQQTSIKA
ncbi:coenzyme A biosynthesis bifunctional protein CoaBC [Thiosulfatimonas sediminis]|uniref:Coenzyme A biosynthesis bifunctional protein CoaBC n=1 Tax=Thiosulfatimonas sediminis TaxID=2675054 RepID=A0A6F8PXQ5_9GAMM|nr:bifunctional phosphopantothenoylcysteine decarboxylase/phosphopantothenate--cysteine ligase CoaBC [Thiosulfatimonas sediminis]BBP46915.1 coenzyme A biosynthesis bifunctional protein CoaBC [Thiosulfatimonas sediminis]